MFYVSYSKRLQKENIVRIACVIIGLCFIFLLSPYASASIFDIFSEIKKVLIEILNFFKHGHSMTIMSIFRSPILNSSTTFVNHLIVITKSIGVMFVCVYTLESIITEAKSSFLNGDKALKIIIKMTLAVVFIIFSDLIIDKVTGFMSSMMNMGFNKIFENSNRFTEAELNQMVSGLSSDEDYFSQLVTLLLLRMLLFPLAFLVDLLVKVISYSIVLELAIRKIFLPIAFADISRNGMRSTGIRSLKKLAAVYIRMLLVVLAFYICGVLSADSIKHAISEHYFSIESIAIGLVEVVMFDVAAWAFVKKASQLADEAMGI